MSALDHKRTFHYAQAMSALTRFGPKADIRRADCHVCLVPIADSCTATISYSVISS